MRNSTLKNYNGMSKPKMLKHGITLKQQSIVKKVQRKRSASSSSMSNKFNESYSTQELVKIRKTHNKSIDNRMLEKSVLKNARYKEEVKNTYKMPPLISEHKITPNNTIVINQNGVDSDLRSRHAITPYASPGKHISPGEEIKMQFLNSRAVLVKSKQNKISHNVKYENIVGFSEIERPKINKFI